jgi:hypothetical protein
MKAVGEAIPEEELARGAAGVEQVSEETRRLAEEARAAGISIEEIVDNLGGLTPSKIRIAEWAQFTRSETENVGATMVDVAFGFADTWATTMNDAIFGVWSFAEAAAAAFRALAAAAIAEINRIIARTVIAKLIQVVTGGVVNIPTGGGGTGSLGDVPGNFSGDVPPAPSVYYGGGRMSVQAGAAMSAPRGGVVPSASGGGSRAVNLSISVSTIMGSRSEAMATAATIGRYLQESGALA